MHYHPPIKRVSSLCFRSRANEKRQISYDVSPRTHYRNAKIIDVNETDGFQYKRNTNHLLERIIQRNNNVVISM